MEVIRLVFSYKDNTAELVSTHVFETSMPIAYSGDDLGYHVVSRDVEGRDLHQVAAYGAFVTHLETFPEDRSQFPEWHPAPAEGGFTVVLPNDPDLDHVIIKNITYDPFLAEREIGRFQIQGI